MNKEYTVQVSDLELTILKIALSRDIKHMEAAQKRDVKNIFVSKTSGTYSIVIGAGGASNAQGGITAAFNPRVNGGSTGSAPTGGAGGSGGGTGGR